MEVRSDDVTERQKTYEKLTITLRDPARAKRLKASAAKRGLGGLSLSALTRVVVDEWLAVAKKANGQ